MSSSSGLLWRRDIVLLSFSVGRKECGCCLRGKKIDYCILLYDNYERERARDVSVYFIVLLKVSSIY